MFRVICIAALFLQSSLAEKLEYSFEVSEANSLKYAEFFNEENRQRITEFEKDLSEDEGLDARWRNFKHTKTVSSGIVTTLSDIMDKYDATTKIHEKNIVKGFRIVLNQDNTYHTIVFTTLELQVYDANNTLVHVHKLGALTCKLVEAHYANELILFFIVTQANEIVKLTMKYKTETNSFHIKPIEGYYANDSSVDATFWVAPYLFLQTPQKLL